MMGRQNNDQGPLFYEFRLDEAVPDDHLARKIDAVLDLSWVIAMKPSAATSRNVNGLKQGDRVSHAFDADAGAVRNSWRDGH